MRSFAIRFAAGTAAVLTLFALLPAAAGAHETRDVAGGQYRLVVGFLNEPVAVGDKSGLDLRVSKPDPAATPDASGQQAMVPVEGLETSLQAEVIYIDQRMPLTIEPRFGQPGAYASYFYPNAVGDYSFHIFGTIEGVAVDEIFTSGPDTFGAVEERLLFPPDQAAAGDGQAVAGAGTVATSGHGFDGMIPAGIAVVAVAVVAAGWWLQRARAGRPAAASAISRS